MSKEFIDEMIERITDSEQDDFELILNDILEYGFIDDIKLCDLFEIDLDDLDDLLSDASELTSKQWKAFCNKLKAYLKKEKAKYARLYYKNPG